MTTEYSIPYKVGLIDVGTKFAQGRLAWSAIAYGKLNSTAGNFVFENANIAPHQSAQVIIQRGPRYVEFFLVLSD